MSRDLLIHCGIAETRIALVSDGVLERYWSELDLPESDAQDAPSRVGDVVLARVKRVVASLNAAFVDIGEERDGFLNARDADGRKGARGGDAPKIAELVHEGERILVQILRDAMDEKGARVGMELTIPGRYLVLTPGSGRATLSRRIEEEGERERLSKIMAGLVGGSAGLGFVVRTAAIGASEEDLREDADYLAEIWAEIETAREQSEPPETLYSEPGLIERVMRDHLGPGVGRIVAGGRKALAAARRYAEEAVPEFAERISLHEGGTPLFDAFGIEDAVATLSERAVTLPSGGWITIEHTEAMTAIDVNSGRHTARSNFESMARETDTEAVEEIARQLILRGIGGLVAIDFIPVADGDAFDAIAERLERRLKEAGIPAEVTRIPRMNLVAATIKRTRTSVDMQGSEECPLCRGAGRRDSVEASALAALREVEASAAAAPGAAIALRVGGEIAAWLEEHSAALRGGAARCGVSALRVYPENGRARGEYAVETIRAEAAK